MAISNETPGLRAEILVDGQPLPEYEDDEAELNTVTRYIEASSNKEFVLRWEFGHPFPERYGVEMRVSIDGAAYRVKIKEANELYRPGGHTKTGVGHKKNHQCFRRNYRFTALNIVEEVPGTVNARQLKQDLESKGNIRMEFRFISNMRESNGDHRSSKKATLQPMGAIPEKALKGDARSHQATLGEPRPARPRRARQEYDYVDATPFATFVFKYRSRASLKALRIINDAEDVDARSLDDMPEDSMNEHQLREALRRARRQDANGRSVKQETHASRRVKRERTETATLADDNNDEVTIVESRSRKRPRGEPEVIVLD
ncbi:hypothetical protein HBI56_118040 [Parastagonospora nodorum]|nr:hypothetical protein HBH56_056730 [Parastagonospora nodorum]KAH3921092.1 hypothetical protein HBH54_245520 [Parastagonospora nodorum]KAH4037558.1 hypothetical protein HBI09_072110 [Parastagonospora nodorum]KAH4053852.1 hypothetical protein HBH49_089310 [Parastagonospora nodorum]KAH4123077.1 hypothetical protein HBH45_246020 [Parastagonospora nodorum]